MADIGDLIKIDNIMYKYDTQRQKELAKLTENFVTKLSELNQYATYNRDYKVVRPVHSINLNGPLTENVKKLLDKSIEAKMF